MQEEWPGFVQRVRGPRNGLDRIWTRKRIVVRRAYAGLHVRLGKYPHPRVGIVRVIVRAVPGCQQDGWRQQCSTAAECWMTADFHQEQNHVRMAVAVERPIRDGAG